MGNNNTAPKLRSCGHRKGRIWEKGGRSHLPTPPGYAPELDVKDVSSMSFWAHDNRWRDDVQEERNKARNKKRVKTDVTWAHDKFVEADQGPKNKEVAPEVSGGSPLERALCLILRKEYDENEREEKREKGRGGFGKHAAKRREGERSDKEKHQGECEAGRRKDNLENDGNEMKKKRKRNIKEKKTRSHVTRARKRHLNRWLQGTGASEMRSQGIGRGRGRKLVKPKKTASDFARESELERKRLESEKKKEEEREEIEESGRYSDAGSASEKYTSDGEYDGMEEDVTYEPEQQTVVAGGGGGGKKRYSSQRQRVVMTTGQETYMQPGEMSEASPREQQIVYVSQQGYPQPGMHYFTQPATLYQQEINPAMLRPVIIQHSPYAMAPSAGGPPGEYVPNMAAMPPRQYDPSQNYPDPNAGLVYNPQQFQLMVPNMQTFIPQQIYQSELPPAGFYQQNIQTIPRHEIPRHEIPRHEIPRHEIPRHEIPRHEIPRHEIPRHEIPWHEIPRHEIPRHEIPRHEIPWHEIPRHEIPRHEIPRHEIPPGSWETSTKRKET